MKPVSQTYESFYESVKYLCSLLDSKKDLKQIKTTLQTKVLADLNNLREALQAEADKTPTTEASGDKNDPSDADLKAAEEVQKHTRVSVRYGPLSFMVPVKVIFNWVAETWNKSSLIKSLSAGLTFLTQPGAALAIAGILSILFIICLLFYAVIATARKKQVKTFKEGSYEDTAQQIKIDKLEAQAFDNNPELAAVMLARISPLIEKVTVKVKAL